MAKKNELPALVASLLITVSLLAGGAWWFLTRGPGGGVNLPTVSSREQQAEDATGSERITLADGRAGSITPARADDPEEKQRGLEALADGDYATAIEEFETALQQKRNDPESVIYLNNARIGEEASYSIAVPVPAGAYLGPALAILRGVAQAQQEINAAGGIDGTPLKVLLFDDQGSPEVAERLAADIAATPDVLGVVGHYSSDTTISASEVYEAEGLPAISATSTAEDVTNGDDDYIFRTVPSDNVAADVLASYVLGTGSRKVAVFYTSSSAYSLSVKQEFEREVFNGSGEIVEAFDVDTPEFSAGAAMQQVEAAGAEAIMLALTEETEDRSLQILSINERELPVVGGDSLYDFNLLDSGQADAVGLTVAVPWDLLSNAQSPFVESSQQLWGASVNWRSAMAYDAIIALAAAIETGGATRAGIQSALADSSFSVAGAAGDIRFLPNGDRRQLSTLVQVEARANSNSKTGYDYVPLQ